ncbi:hypothetical protein [Xanthovirga aplysinae]|nr:hypothetical protein [Xanthovirga aplysinae]
MENGRGADILSVWWYNRNLQEITESSMERILFIIENGHASVLGQ